jgi:predicted enzyme related to lactoylglutathione lyase
VPEDFLQMLWDAGLDPAEYEAYYAALNPEGTRPRFLFQRREKSRPEHYPIHLDFWADDREGEIERLGGLGAAVEQTKTAGDRTWTIMRDPEGNPFCVEEHRPQG